MMDRHLVRGESGASSVEYGLIVFAIAAVVALVVFAFGTNVQGLFVQSCESIGGTVAPGSDCTP